MTDTHSPAPDEIPSHVPEDLVRPIGLASGPEFLADPYGFMASLHDTHPPVFYSPNPYGGGSWVIPKYEDCFHILRDPQTFSNRGGTPFPRDPDDYFDFIPQEIDPPDHRKYRAILDRKFSPAAMLALEPELRTLANDLIDRFIDKGACDFSTEFSRPLPVSVFLGLMGLPLDMRDTFVGWAVDLLHSQNLELMQAAMRNVVSFLRKAIAGKAARPDDSALSLIVHARPDGVPLTDREIIGFAFFVFIAGLDTVYATLNNTFLWLARNPQRRNEIAAHPERLAQTVEELLRVFTVTFAGRSVTKDIELRGISIKKGDRLVCVLPAANFDPDIFPDPRQVKFDRPRKPILAFAAGVHSCMGAHLARLEMKVCIGEFLRRIPDFRLQDDAVINYLPGGVIGPESLPLVWTNRAAQSA